MAVDQKHLLFSADPPDAALNETTVEHVRERAQIFQQPLHERLRLLLVDVLRDVVFSHNNSQFLRNNRTTNGSIERVLVRPRDFRSQWARHQHGTWRPEVTGTN